MADLRINELTFDPSGQDVVRDDLIHIQRNSVDRKARLDGGLLLPAYNPVSDKGKTLQIDSAGNVAWLTPSTTAYSRLVTRISPTSPLVVDGYDLYAYRDIRIVFEIGAFQGSDTGTEVRVVELPAGVPRGFSGDGKVQAWLQSGTRIGYQFFHPDSGDPVAAQQAHVYGRR